MNKGQRQIIAEKIGSTVRVLELLGYDYDVSAPRMKREKGNRSPRVVNVKMGDGKLLRVYNSVTGFTWANGPDGEPIASVKSVEELYAYLAGLKG
jgi:hypothetical protein